MCLLLHASILLWFSTSALAYFCHKTLPSLCPLPGCFFSRLLLSSSAAINGIAGAAGKQTIAITCVTKASGCMFAVITTDVEDWKFTVSLQHLALVLTLNLLPSFQSSSHLIQLKVFLCDWRAVLKAVLVKPVNAEAANSVHVVQEISFSLYAVASCTARSAMDIHSLCTQPVCQRLPKCCGRTFTNLMLLTLRGALCAKVSANGCFSCFREDKRSEMCWLGDALPRGEDVGSLMLVDFFSFWLSFIR